MKFKIDSRIFGKFPDLVIGVIVANNIDNNVSNDGIISILRSAENEVKMKISADRLIELPNVAAWRNAYHEFGAKPKEHRSSIENLCRLVLNGAALKHINPVVDLYNCVSLKHLLPVGGEDTSKISGDLILSFAGPDEPKVLLLGDMDARSPHPGEVIYKDDISAVCRRWNWREADRTKLTSDTKNCILVIEGLPPVTRKEVENAVLDLKNLVNRYCGGNVSYFILDENKSEIIDLNGG